MPSRDPRIDTYIRNAAPFAQPILTRLRTIIHTACPDVVETIKWRVPSFEHQGILCGLAAFKAHCGLGFWKQKPLEEGLSAADARALAQAGGMTSIDQLPDDRALVRIVRAAAKLNEDGVELPRRKAGTKPPLKTPAFFLAAVRKNKKALATFRAFSSSHQREYVEWVTGAKTEETRSRRLATAVTWMAEGKSRNWQYERAT
ncbi:MAG: YdeI/OmpD-associated family protein [Vicinamibacterales bacterium]